VGIRTPTGDNRTGDNRKEDSLLVDFQIGDSRPPPADSFLVEGIRVEDSHLAADNQAVDNLVEDIPVEDSLVEDIPVGDRYLPLPAEQPVFGVPQRCR
jgi:hypothetical protein